MKVIDVSLNGTIYFVCDIFVEHKKTNKNDLHDHIIPIIYFLHKKFITSNSWTYIRYKDFKEKSATLFYFNYFNDVYNNS